MKPFLGVNVTNNPQNETLNGEEFIVAKAPAALRKELDTITHEEISLILKPSLPLPAEIAQCVCGLVGIVGTIMMTLLTLAEESFELSAAYQAMPWVFWAIGVSLVAFALLTYIGHKREKERFDKSGHTDRYDEVAREIQREFGVPEEAIEVEVLSFRYKQYQGNLLLQKPSDPDEADYDNFVFDAFVRDGALYLADTEDCYCLPLSAFRAIRRVDKPILVSDWFKDGDHNKGEYKPYGLTMDEEFRVTVPFYYILEMEYENETWGIWIPCYELTAFETLTGIKGE